LNGSTPARRERQRNEPNDIDDGATHLGMLNENALRLLQIMGRRGSWTSDLLFERSALPFPELQHAILLLELEGRVRRRRCHSIPVADKSRVASAGEQSTPNASLDGAAEASTD
jgi:hypothetical protein